MTSHVCPPLSLCLSCLDDVLLGTVLRDDEVIDGSTMVRGVDGHANQTVPEIPATSPEHQGCGVQLGMPEVGSSQPANLGRAQCGVAGIKPGRTSVEPSDGYACDPTQDFRTEEE